MEQERSVSGALSLVCRLRKILVPQGALQQGLGSDMEVQIMSV